MRTVQVLGYGFGKIPATLTASLDNREIYSGPVHTITESISTKMSNQSKHDLLKVLFDFEVPLHFKGQIPMSITVYNSPVVFALIRANYASGPNNFSSIFATWSLTEISDCRANVSIDGIEQTISEHQRGTNLGTWWWTVQPGSTLAYDLRVTAGQI